MSQENLTINEPGLNVLPPGVERYVINGGGLTGVQIFPEDKIEIINNEGNQVCEVVVFNSKGISDPSVLNLKPHKSENDIIKILKRNEESSKIVLRQLEKRNLQILKSKSSILFDKDTPPGEKITINAKDKCYCIFSAPGNNMLVHEQNPPTELTLFVKRNNIVDFKEHRIIPDPIFDPLDEKNIAKQSAISFEVKQGDYIQIICPTGRQCSDFVAFDTAKLHKGIEKGLSLIHI